jgi:hypothetical protein
VTDADIERLASEYIAEDWTPDRYYRDMNLIAFATKLLEHAYAEGRKDEREEQETFLRDLLWGEAQVCCGNYHAGYGGEYMGQVEMVPVCCGCPDVERNDDAQILAVLRARVPDPEICQTCHADPIPGHSFCPDCKDEWTA